MRLKALYLNGVVIDSASTWHEVAEILTKRFARLITAREVQRHGNEGPDGFYVTMQT